MPLCGFIVCSKILELAHVSPDPFVHKKVGSGHKPLTQNLRHSQCLTFLHLHKSYDKFCI